MYEGSNKKKMTTGSWIAVGVLSVVAVGGLAAVAMKKRPPASLQWFGYEIQVESRGLDEASADGKPLRWSVSQDNQILASGLAETHPLAVDAAKSAIELLAEAKTVVSTLRSAAAQPPPHAYPGEVG